MVLSVTCGYVRSRAHRAVGAELDDAHYTDDEGNGSRYCQTRNVRQQFRMLFACQLASTLAQYRTHAARNRCDCEREPEPAHCEAWSWRE